MIRKVVDELVDGPVDDGLGRLFATAGGVVVVAAVVFVCVVVVVAGIRRQRTGASDMEPSSVRSDVPTETLPEAAAMQFEMMLDNMAAQTDDPTLQA